jgi:hypothetical protein
VTTPNNNVLVEQLRVSGVPIDFTKTYNLGDMVKWDSVHNLAIPIVALTDQSSSSAAANFIGVSLDNQPITSLNINLPTPRINVCTRGLVKFNVSDGATYNPGDQVAIGADAQSIVRSAGSSSTAIGVVAPENFFSVTGSPATTTGITPGIGGTILVYLKPQFTSLTSF